MCSIIMKTIATSAGLKSFCCVSDAKTSGVDIVDANF